MKTKKTFESYAALLFAAALFLSSVIYFVNAGRSSGIQADRILKKLYTVTAAQEIVHAPAEAFRSAYAKQFEKDMTEEGMESAIRLGIPNGLLGGNALGKVERTYAESVTLEELEAEKELVSYRYQVNVEFRYERGLNVIQPVVSSMHTGVITLKKTGFMTWKMEQIEVK